MTCYEFIQLLVLMEIHLIRPGCLRPSITLTVQYRGLKHQSFVHLVLWVPGGLLINRIYDFKRLQDMSYGYLVE